MAEVAATAKTLVASLQGQLKAASEKIDSASENEKAIQQAKEHADEIKSFYAEVTKLKDGIQRLKLEEIQQNQNPDVIKKQKKKTPKGCKDKKKRITSKNILK